EAGRDLVVGGCAVRKRELEVDVASIEAGEGAESDLEPLVAAACTLPRAADPDPAGDVAGCDAEGRQRRDHRADPEGARGRCDARVRVAARAAGERPRCADERAKCRNGRGEENPQAPRHPGAVIGRRPLESVPSYEGFPPD